MEDAKDNGRIDGDEHGYNGGIDLINVHNRVK